ncbi:N-(5'-phosphoribosyl)anthranilate isomerase [Bryobacterales bacterium F-183]|nr:N-(5'-phosphoribosyl)anthranilate isomerase [Bryobacterales bacterium F-183]
MIVKVCGITTVEDALMSVEAGADALGFNFYPKSPRYVTPEVARQIADEVPPGILRVGVFVNESPEFVLDVARLADLDVVQLHGGACPSGTRVWRAKNAGPDFDPAEVEGDAVPEAFVLDSPAPGTYGGTGVPFDWTRIPALTRNIVLAGGLDGSNVADAIRVARPWGVDACSRLERAPGRKDPAKVAAFVAAARSVETT